MLSLVNAAVDRSAIENGCVHETLTRGLQWHPPSPEVQEVIYRSHIAEILLESTVTAIG